MRTLLILLAFALPLAAAEPVLEKQSLFEPATGGYAVYRIPGLVVTEKGTLIAYCEARKNNASDWGAIDLLLRRSTDGGKTWSEPKKFDVGSGFEKNPVAVNQKLGKFPEITINNPVMITDRGIIHFLYCVEYMHCFYSRSEDDGATFTPPVEITSTFQEFKPEYDWKVLATGPGHGIRLSKNGRLIVPVWMSTGDGGHAHRPSAVSVIFSDDAGKSWKRGDWVVKHPDLANPSETAVVELPDGRVMLNIRHESAPHQRAVSFSDDGATKWSKPVRDVQLPEPICMGSLLRFGERVLFSNPHNTDGRDRRNLSIHVSDDGAKSWSHRRAIEPGLSGYSDLAAGRDGWVYCLYERTGGLILAKFNAEWMIAKPTRVICLGDSITKGYRPGVKEEEAFPALLDSAIRKDGGEVLNVGIGGETSSQGLKRLKATVIDQKPDVVTIMYGANDSYIDKGKSATRVTLDEYRSNLTKIVRELRQGGVTPILMTTNRYGDGHPPDGSGKHPQSQMDQYMKACREVASAEKVPLIDHQQLWTDSAKAGTDIETWMTDHVHPNVAGHAELAKAILPTLREAIKTAKK
jgi:sialidase-1